MGRQGQVGIVTQKQVDVLVNLCYYIRIIQVAMNKERFISGQILEVCRPSLASSAGILLAELCDGSERPRTRANMLSMFIPLWPLTKALRFHSGSSTLRIQSNPIHLAQKSPVAKHFNFIKASLSWYPLGISNF